MQQRQGTRTASENRATQGKVKETRRQQRYKQRGTRSTEQENRRQKKRTAKQERTSTFIRTYSTRIKDKRPKSGVPGAFVAELGRALSYFRDHNGPQDPISLANSSHHLTTAIFPPGRPDLAGLFDHTGPRRTIRVPSEFRSMLPTKTDKNHLLHVHVSFLYHGDR